MRATPLHVNCGDPGRESDNLLLPARLKISAKCKIFAAGCFTAAFEVPLLYSHFLAVFKPLNTLLKLLMYSLMRNF